MGDNGVTSPSVSAWAVSARPAVQWVRTRLAPVSRAIELAVDVFAWWIGLLALLVIRYGVAGLDLTTRGLLIMWPVAAVVQAGAGRIFGLYSGRWRYGSFEEVAALVRSVAVTAPVLLLADRFLPGPGGNYPVPITVALGACVPALFLMAGTRYAWRLALESTRPPQRPGAIRTLVFGAGEAGAQIVTAMLRDPKSPYTPVALIDDDPRKRNRRIMTVSVVGDRDQLSAAAQRFDAQALLVALPSVGAALVQDINQRGMLAGLDVKILPSLGELVSDTVSLSDIRDVSVKDLLGREEGETDLHVVAGYLSDRRVLVTGAGGSIGSELCRQIVRWGPSELVMLDRDESALMATQFSLPAKPETTAVDYALLDIRDEKRLAREFDLRKPQVVFHAAALKHATLLEANADEALKTNVWGTAAVLRAAATVGVDHFVNISSDKAAEPANVLGYSKRIAERLTSWFAQDQRGAFLSVRFGNVLGSRGSVLETFRSQIAAGGPVTVTDPEVSRYFMTISEAVQLVIQAGAIGASGEVLVLEMGEPVLILDVAKQLVARHNKPIDIIFTGLRPGDKMHEQLFGDDEVGECRVHPLISHVYAAPLAPYAIYGIDPDGPDVAEALRGASSA